MFGQFNTKNGNQIYGKPKEIDWATKFRFKYFPSSKIIISSGSNIGSDKIIKIATLIVSYIKTFSKDVFKTFPLRWEFYFIIMSRQATTVVAKAEGATNQKSRGDPNQQIGVMKAAQNNINLKNLCVSLFFYHLTNALFLYLQGVISWSTSK